MDRCLSISMYCAVRAVCAKEPLKYFIAMPDRTMRARCTNNYCSDVSDTQSRMNY